ncbi:hypothetical protein [Leeuwenhoekiella parthenopeia]|uniref:Uncharacterized protein n=1 Tax=Leeuwenhoekiella parthenopeia TaxID=2890320 RepID=A0ABS8GX24_9FLAO|nr:hypothetical protein [Leeuwenhoekiella parthenopeia]MCC4214560.1 hypothetical protein [Leeuwenhoekiella parthenopeia]
MIFKSKNIQLLLSIFLVLAVFAFKVADLHKYVHDKDDLNNHHCELCLLSQKQKNQTDFYLPQAYDGVQSPVVVITRIQKTFFYTTIQTIPVLTGKSLNKAPPSASV